MSKASSGGGASVGGGGPSASGRSSDGRHGIALPKNKRRVTIDQTSAAIKEMGGTFHFETGKFDLKTKETTYEVTMPGGGRKRLGNKEINKLIYGGQRG